MSFVPSDKAKLVLDQISTGDKYIIYNKNSCFFYDKPRKEIADTIELGIIEELILKGHIAPLSQYGFNHKLGWREVIGSIGEQFDVYCCIR